MLTFLFGCNLFAFFETVFETSAELVWHFWGLLWRYWGTLLKQQYDNERTTTKLLVTCLLMKSVQPMAFGERNPEHF